MGKGKLKATRRVHLQALARQGDVAAEVELYHGPKLPPLAAHVWNWWIDLCSTRGGNGFGPSPLTRHDLHAFEEDEGVRFEPWERRAIFRIDAAWRASLQPREEEG